MIRTLLFDLGDVLVKLDSDRAHRAAAARCGKSAADVRRMLNESGITVPYERGEIDSVEFHRRCDAMLGLNVDFEGFCDLWNGMFSRDELVSPDLLRTLSSRYRLAIVSNTNALHYERIRSDYPFLDIFPQAILSYEVGFMKPSTGIYLAALKATESRPEECFFTDDRVENVEGARAVGLHATVFGGQATLEQDLRAAGVVW